MQAQRPWDEAALRFEGIAVIGFDPPKNKGVVLNSVGDATGPAQSLDEMNRRSMAARYWRQPGYRYQGVSIHDARVADFWRNYPLSGWAHVQVDDVQLAMLTANDDGVALVYHAFGPDAYEAASVAAWVSIARVCSQVADVGAFTGLFAMLAKRAAPQAQVLAVEPNSASRARLHTNLTWNGMHNLVQVMPQAVAKTIGVMALHVPMGADLLDTGASLLDHGQSTRTELVTTAPIDALLEQAALGAPDLMKIDVEGFEEAALLGAPRALANGATLVLEIQAAALFLKCRTILESFGYRLFVIDDDNLDLAPAPMGDGVDLWFQDYVRGRALNYLCVTREAHLQLARRGVDRVRGLLPA